MLHEPRVEEIFNSLIRSDFGDISDAEAAEINTRIVDVTSKTLQTEVGAEELNTNINKAVNIHVPKNDNNLETM